MAEYKDYQPPTDAQIEALAKEGERIAAAFFRAAELMGADGMRVYAEGVGASFQAAKDGLLVIDALKSGDFKLPEGALAKFQAEGVQTLEAMQAMNDQAGAMVKLAAIPWGELGDIPKPEDKT